MPAFLFGEQEMRVCDRLAYTLRTAGANDAAGQHRTRRAGDGFDFLDYRPYVPGDDVRRIDWMVYARLREPYIRQLQHETLLYVHILVDVSSSMIPAETNRKLSLACQVAMGLALVALRAGDQVSLGVFSDELEMLTRGQRGPAAFPSMLHRLRAVEPGGKTALADVSRSFLAQRLPAGLVIIISDFLCPAEIEDATRSFARRSRLLAIQVLDQVDWGEGLGGPLHLTDAETGRALEVYVTERQLAEYQQRLRSYLQTVTRQVHRLGQGVLQVRTDEPWSMVAARVIREKSVFR